MISEKTDIQGSYRDEDRRQFCGVCPVSGPRPPPAGLLRTTPGSTRVCHPKVPMGPTPTKGSPDRPCARSRVVWSLSGVSDHVRVRPRLLSDQCLHHGDDQGCPTSTGTTGSRGCVRPADDKTRGQGRTRVGPGRDGRPSENGVGRRVPPRPESVGRDSVPGVPCEGPSRGGRSGGPPLTEKGPWPPVGRPRRCPLTSAAPSVPVSCPPTSPE